MMETNARRQLSVCDLPLIAIRVAHRAGFAPEVANASPPPAIRSIRVKPGRGLTALLTKKGGRQRRLDGALSVTIGPDAIDRSRFRFSLPELEGARLDRPAPGLAIAPGLAVAVQMFPADARLPALAECLDTDCERPLFSILQAAACRQSGGRALTLISVRAEPVRYKIGRRCVIAYHLGSADDQGSVLIGKLYSDTALALRLQRSLELLRSHFGTGGPSLPRPLAADARLGLLLTDAFTRPAGDDSVAAGEGRELGQTWQPNFSQLCAEGLTLDDRCALRQAAQAIAQLHSAPADGLELRLRDGAMEADSVKERAQRLAAAHPALSTRLGRLGELLAGRLVAGAPFERVVAHGGFKRSQLICASDRLHLVDFDGLCLADAALDVGCFLAYLRPHGMFAGRRTGRNWFEAAALEFVAAYRENALAAGSRPESVRALFERARAYEASHLFKIATRGLNRLNSPREVELQAICEQIEVCIDPLQGTP